MPVPKKRLGHSDQGHRRSNWKATVPSLMICPSCGDSKLTHMLCKSCGHYNKEDITDRFPK